MPELVNPLVLGVPLTHPEEVLPVASLLLRTGQNTGNLLFAKATRELFPDGRYIAFSQFKPHQVSGHDCIVLAAANWLSPKGDMGPLVDNLDATDVPIIALGLGAQAELGGKIPTLKPGMQRLISLLAERSPFIAARGPFSCEVLAHYGATNARATGCPSLLLTGGKQPAFAVSAEPGPLRARDVVLHGTRHQFNQTDGFHAAIYRQALAQGHDILLQSELADFYPALERLEEAEDREKILSCLAEAYQAPAETVATYLRSHGHVFFTMEEWFAYYRSKRFVVGTRIHGTIAAVLSGTPALLIAHDARTAELAETMGIPFVMKADIDAAQPLPVAALYERALAHDFTPGFQRYWQGYSDFFADSGLYSPLIQQQETGA